MGGEVDEPLSAEVLDPDASGEWDEVRESWVDDDLSKLAPAGPSKRAQPPPPRRDRASAPPPLPPPHITSAMLERLAAGDYEGTLIAARTALAIHETNDDALQCLEMATRTLRALYRTRLGLAEGEDRAPRPTGAAGILDRRSRTVFDLVDARATVEEICERSPLDALDTLKILSELSLSNVVVLAAP